MTPRPISIQGGAQRDAVANRIMSAGHVSGTLQDGELAAAGLPVEDAEDVLLPDARLAGTSPPDGAGAPAGQPTPGFTPFTAADWPPEPRFHQPHTTTTRPQPLEPFGQDPQGQQQQHQSGHSFMPAKPDPSAATPYIQRAPSWLVGISLDGAAAASNEPGAPGRQVSQTIVGRYSDQPIDVCMSGAEPPSHQFRVPADDTAQATLPRRIADEPASDNSRAMNQVGCQAQENPAQLPDHSTTAAERLIARFNADASGNYLSPPATTASAAVPGPLTYTPSTPFAESHQELHVSHGQNHQAQPQLAATHLAGHPGSLPQQRPKSTPFANTPLTQPAESNSIEALQQPSGIQIEASEAGLQVRAEPAQASADDRNVPASPGHEFRSDAVKPVAIDPSAAMVRHSSSVMVGADTQAAGMSPAMQRPAGLPMGPETSAGAPTEQQGLQASETPTRPLTAAAAVEVASGGAIDVSFSQFLSGPAHGQPLAPRPADGTAHATPQVADASARVTPGPCNQQIACTAAMQQSQAHGLPPSFGAASAPLLQSTCATVPSPPVSNPVATSAATIADFEPCNIAFTPAMTPSEALVLSQALPSESQLGYSNRQSDLTTIPAGSYGMQSHVQSSNATPISHVTRHVYNSPDDHSAAAQQVRLVLANVQAVASDHLESFASDLN